MEEYTMQKRTFALVSAMGLAVFFATVLLTGLSSASPHQPTSLPHPAVYYVEGNIGVVTDTVTSTVFVNGVSLTQSMAWGGKDIWFVPLSEGSHMVVSGDSEQTVLVYDLSAEEVFTDTLTSYVKANATRVGLAVYEDALGGFKLYSITGTGYDGWFPNGSLWWNYATSTWSTTSVWGPYTFVAVPIPVSPTATATSAPSATPPVNNTTFSVYFPLVTRPHGCLSASPLLPIYWQEASRLGVCSAHHPGFYDGSTPTLSTDPGFNWSFEGVADGIVLSGNDGRFEYLGFVAVGGPIGVWEHPDVEAFDAVYTITGEGFNYYLIDTNDEVKWWDLNTRTWSNTAVWGVRNIMGVINR
jgi:hypothetical protein